MDCVLGLKPPEPEIHQP